MRYLLTTWLCILLVGAIVSGWGTASLAQPAGIAGTSWPLIGPSQLKVQQGGKFKQAITGRIDFGLNDEFVLVLNELFAMAGTYETSENGRRVVLTPDPDSVDDALISLLEVTVFGFALRGIESDRVHLRFKVREKKGRELAKLRLRIKFKGLLALAPEDPDDPGPEVVRPFRMRFRYKAKTPPD